MHGYMKNRNIDKHRISYRMFNNLFTFILDLKFIQDIILAHIAIGDAYLHSSSTV